MPISDQIVTTKARIAKPPGRCVAVVVYEGLCAFEFGCAAEVFGLPRPELGASWYRFETCAVGRRQLRSQYGMRITADGGLDRLAHVDTIVIPGWTSIETPVPAALQRALRDAHARGARLVSICSGAFVLAACGLLDGKRAATHWRYADTMRERYPKIIVDPDVLYVDEDQLLTSAGSAAGLDACLHLVRRDYGADIANHVAKRLVIPPHRDGGQAQFVERPVQRRQNHPISALIDMMRKQLDRPLPLSELARMAAMSERTFIRRFKQATGTTPGNWLVLARIDHARSLLETSTHSIDNIAEQCGFGTAMTLRHHFRQKLGVSPATYRQRFHRTVAISGNMAGC